MILVNNGLDYGSLNCFERFEIDKKAYSKYYDDYFDIKNNEENWYDQLLTYNKWYGTELHKKYVTPLLRKMKLEKIEESNIF